MKIFLFLKELGNVALSFGPQEIESNSFGKLLALGILGHSVVSNHPGQVGQVGNPSWLAAQDPKHYNTV
jgi:hypothetical protein